MYPEAPFSEGAFSRSTDPKNLNVFPKSQKVFDKLLRFWEATPFVLLVPGMLF
jgi:hypothetical protein